jgi:putative transcriptional regulator
MAVIVPAMTEPPLRRPDEAGGMTPTPPNRLRDCRLEKNLSQAELGRRLGISGQTVRAMEGGGYAPSITLACRVARLLGQPVESLFQP